PEFIRPAHRRNETLGFLKKPLTDLCISRPKARLQWGIELPFDTDYVCYVWFDALINYISGVGYGKDPEEFKKWWPASVHLIGKDILTTHTVYWPTMLKAIGLEMPKTIFAHGWWLIGRDKMSKSTGNVVNPMDMCDKYGVDAFRYFLMTEMTPGQDASFTEEAFIKCYNSNLANDLGNMLNRVNKLIFKHFDGKVPTVTLPLGPDEEHLRDITITAAKHLEEEIKDYNLNRAWDAIMAAVRAGNKYMESKAPWVLAKEGKVEELALVLYSAAESLRLISGLLSPVMPEKMAEMRGALGIDALAETIDIETLEVWGQLEAGRQLNPISALFKRIDVKEALGDLALMPPKKKKAKNVIELIDIEDFAKVSLKTAKVISAEPVEGASKLLKLQVEVGQEKRQVIAGIADFYQPEALIGKLVVLVSNLKPAEIRGVESNGMLLAAKKKKKLALITIDAEDFPTGVSVG
ncbi:MAG: methionine--tRNA ligase subunit beta, partial [Lentisphaeria bacterium]|nr:methionine--tRNA ligase subunit beta [Lentisphaeria bacterium]